jgi:hypothetical protein
MNTVTCFSTAHYPVAGKLPTGAANKTATSTIKPITFSGAQENVLTAGLTLLLVALAALTGASNQPADSHNAAPNVSNTPDTANFRTQQGCQKLSRQLRLN